MNEKELTEILFKYKEVCKMDDVEFYKFCKRYASRNITTVVWLFNSKLSTNISTKNVAEKLQKVLSAYANPSTIKI